MTLKKKPVNAMMKNRFLITSFVLLKSIYFAFTQNYNALCFSSRNDSVLIEKRDGFLFIEDRPRYIEPEWIAAGLERKSLFEFDTINVSFQNGVLEYSDKIDTIRINTLSMDTIPYNSIKGLSRLAISPQKPLIFKGKKSVYLNGKEHYCFQFFQDGSVFDNHSAHKYYKIIYIDSVLLIPIKVIIIKFEPKIVNMENIGDVNFYYLDNVEFH